MHEEFFAALDAAEEDEADFRHAIDDLVQLSEVQVAFAAGRAFDIADIEEEL
ncbi:MULTISPECIES: hypothetical protein [unclassified Caballeronia]|uniref:hypothetical protein n=1 Tax=unclassified Caballeronia TaxID=2646786 RepID=UPI0020284C29|nr:MULTISPECIES: hypothetical protein [unclassified Caballeronia]